MPQTKVIIIYSPNQNRRRRVIIPSDDSQTDLHAQNIAKGESVLIGTIADYRNIGSDAMLKAHTGQGPAPDKCIVVGKGVNPTILAVFCGDPLIDTHPLGTVVSDVTGKATVGLSFVNGIAVLPDAPIANGTSL